MEDGSETSDGVSGVEAAVVVVFSLFNVPYALACRVTFLCVADSAATPFPHSYERRFGMATDAAAAKAHLFVGRLDVAASSPCAHSQSSLVSHRRASRRPSTWM